MRAEMNGPAAFPSPLDDAVHFIAQIFQSSTSGACLIDANKVVRWANQVFAWQLNLPEGGIIGRPSREVLPGWSEQLSELFDQVRATGEGWNASAFHYTVPSPPESGTPGWDISISPVNGHDGQFLGWLFLQRGAAQPAPAGQSPRDRLGQAFDEDASIGWQAEQLRYQAESLRIRCEQLQAQRREMMARNQGLAAQVEEWRERAQQLARTNRELQETEHLIQETEDRLRQVVEHSPDHFFYQDLDQTYLWVSKPFPSLTEDQMLGKTDYDILPEGEARSLSEIKHRVIETGEPSRIEADLTFGGEEHWYEVIYEPWQGKQTRIRGLFGYARDVTRSKQADIERDRLLQEERARAAEERQQFVRDCIGPLLAIDNEALRLTELVATLLDVSQAHLGRLELKRQEFDLLELVRSAAREAQTARRGLQITVESNQDQITGSWDYSRLHRVVSALLSIAARNTPAENPINVSVRAEGREAVVAVRYGRAGMEAGGEREATAGPASSSFDQQASLPQAELNLDVAEKIIQVHGGRMWAEDQAAEGRSLNFSLPFDQASGETDASPEASSTRETGQQALDPQGQAEPSPYLVDSQETEVKLPEVGDEPPEMGAEPPEMEVGTAKAEIDFPETVVG